MICALMPLPRSGPVQSRGRRQPDLATGKLELNGGTGRADLNTLDEQPNDVRLLRREQLLPVGAYPDIEVVEYRFSLLATELSTLCSKLPLQSAHRACRRLSRGTAKSVIGDP
jgi:hypothetical protein